MKVWTEYTMPTPGQLEIEFSGDINDLEAVRDALLDALAKLHDISYEIGCDTTLIDWDEVTE